MKGRMLEVAPDFHFRRKHLVSDLWNPDTLLTNTDIAYMRLPQLLEAYKDDPLYHLEGVDTVGCIIDDPDEVVAALSINPGMRPNLILILPETPERITKKLLDAFHPVARCSVAIRNQPTPNHGQELAKRIAELDSKNFSEFQRHTIGYVLTTIRPVVDDIIDAYSSVFTQDPFWCVQHTHWKYGSCCIASANRTSDDFLEAATYQCRFVADNLLGRRAYSPSAKKEYSFNYYAGRSTKEVAISPDCITLANCIWEHHSALDFEFNNKPDSKTLNKLRKFYDVQTLVPQDGFTLESPFENWLATGSPAVAPEWLHIIENALRRPTK